MDSDAINAASLHPLVLATIRARLAARPDSEHVQALVRIAISCVVWLYAFGRLARDERHVLFVISSYVLIATVLFVLIVTWPRASPGRRLFGMTLDLSTLSYVMYEIEDKAILLFALYLWVIIGNGFRYGTRYLYVAMAMAIGGFAIVFGSSTYWREQSAFSAGLLIGLIALPLYFSVLLRQLSSQHAELKELYEQVARHATHDGLTSLPNRQHFNDQLVQAIAWAQRSGRTLTLLYLDLDGFKAINDALGHAVGDQLIEHTARRLERCVRKDDVVARVGGDEFVVLLANLVARDAAEIAETIVASLSKPFGLADKQLSISASIGLATYPQDGADANTLIHAADSAMYEAKRSGKNRYRMYRAKRAPFVPVVTNG